MLALEKGAEKTAWTRKEYENNFYKWTAKEGKFSLYYKY